jgi:hypothetical protein
VLAPGRADLHSLAALPSTRAIADRDVFYVARVVAAPSNSIETRSRPRFLAATHRGFTFYVAPPGRSIVEDFLARRSAGRD